MLCCSLLCALLASTIPLSRQQVIDQMMNPYHGPTTRQVDCSTLQGKVMCGYQGWFNTPGDGLGRGWFHWASDPTNFSPGNCKIDLWPDVSELTPAERYDTSFKLANGKPAQVFSSFNKKTVLRHFKWMQDYGIDGVFVQRFIVETQRPLGFIQRARVLDSCREGANRFGRTYAVMYDLSGLGANSIDKVIDDWKLLVDHMHITEDPAYLHDHGKPVVAVWGFGFSDGRKYTLDDGLKLVSFLKNDPHYGGCTVMLGIPTYWREQKWDCVTDPKMKELLLNADVISPWTVGRYRTPEQARHYGENVMSKDIAWCKNHHKDYLPVVFPGFSWHNLNPKSPLNEIPRLKGKFLWTQYYEAKQQGATMVYQAMFDEVDEGTAIFKCTNDVPVGESKFVTYEGLPSDYYLKLVGAATKMIRGNAPPSEKMPDVESPAH
jgi:hypothetical protein